MTLEGSTVSELGAVVTADLADVADAWSHQLREVLRLLVVPLVVVAQLRLVAEAGLAHPALVDGDGESQLPQLCCVLALPLGGSDLFQEALLSLALLALGSHLPGVLEKVGLARDFLDDTSGVEVFHVFVFYYSDNAGNLLLRARVSSGGA